MCRAGVPREKDAGFWIRPEVALGSARRDASHATYPPPAPLFQGGEQWRQPLRRIFSSFFINMPRFKREMWSVNSTPFR